jgi:hypothetical protein
MNSMSSSSGAASVAVNVLRHGQVNASESSMVISSSMC